MNGTVSRLACSRVRKKHRREKDFARKQKRRVSGGDTPAGRGEERRGSILSSRGDTFRQGRNSPSSSLASPRPAASLVRPDVYFRRPFAVETGEHRFAGVLCVKTRYRIGCTFRDGCRLALLALLASRSREDEEKVAGRREVQAIFHSQEFP